ncbi:MAG: four helix bundle protein [Phycisphaeraceae bacterium]|nr:four helix bundle protein [Phycisphaeraceae bacterium]
MVKAPNARSTAAEIPGPPVRAGKGRLQPQFIARVEEFSDRCVAVAEQLERDGRFRRIVEQLAASGSAVGANLAEADEAMSRRDFRKSLAIAAKELAETRFWLHLAVRRAWLVQSRLDPLLAELSEIKRIVGAILTRTAPKPKSTNDLQPPPTTSSEAT